MKRTVPLILTLSFTLGIALPGAAESPRPATESSKPSTPAAHPVDNAKASTFATKKETFAGLKDLPNVRHPSSTGGAVTGVTLSWSSVNGGGIIEGTVPGSRLSASASQSVVLQGTNSGFALSGGFWYGAQGCNCPSQLDLDANGFVDSIDLSLIIDEIFFGGPMGYDTTCTHPRSDGNCDGFTDSIDLAYMMDLIFFGGIGPCNPCSE